MSIIKKGKKDSPINENNKPLFTYDNKNKVNELDKSKDENNKPIKREKTRVQARNRKYTPLKPKIIHIKLMLEEFTHNKDAIEHALNNSHRWTPYNIKEIREHLKKIEENLNKRTFEWIKHYKTSPDEERWGNSGYHNPALWYSIITKEKLYSILDIQYYYPEWMKNLNNLLDLWETSRKDSAIYKEELTTKEWFERIEIKFPEALEKEANDVIENRYNLRRTGIFEDLELLIKEQLQIEDVYEYYYKLDKLEPFDITKIKTLIYENPEHPYSILLKEKIDGLNL